MLSKLQKRNRNSEKGFTIIEVMIVLAIAGLILLIVFLAVPALQRSSRNTQRKNDVGRIGSAAQTLVSNDNGTVSTASLANVARESGNLSYYDPANISVADGSTAAVTNPNDSTKVIVVANAKCDPANVGDSTPQAKQIAILYSTESGTSNTDAVCIDE